MKKLNRLSLVLSICIGILATAPAASQTTSQTTSQQGAKKFGTLLSMLDRLYVDSIEMDKLVETAIVKMLEELDPHSVYFSEDDLKDANEPLDGSFEGIGVQFNIFKDTIMVVSPIAGGPSERLGIRAGDRIVQVEQEYVAGVGVTTNDVIRLLKGPKGTMVKVFIKRDGEKDLLAFNIERDKIPIFSVVASHMVEPTIGYIKISRFAKTTLEELRTALSELKDKGMKDLILDLQGNGGGMLRTAINMSDEFLSDDKLIVYTEGRAFPREDTYTSYEGLFERGRLVILMDDGSASASEIVAGAVQDWDRGLIVGRRSFGKGLVQRPIDLGDGSAVRLTVQKYYTPAGRCIQKPYDEGIDAYRDEKYDRYQSGELLSLDSLDLPESLKYETRIKKRTVYGGGGILPDVFVPIDTTANSETFRNLLRKGMMSSYALEFVDIHRSEIENEYPTEDDFVNQYIVSEKEIKAFQEWAQEKGSEEDPIEFPEDDWEISGDAITLRLKAFIGRNTYSQSTFYRVIGDLNEALNEAIEILNDGRFENSKLAHKSFQ
ncbi:MAG: S41 family peptidase [Bacteroidetes bacterium]|nr:S41 family peptidase [Bacteroidota bacterium]MDA1383073.1 S41 family peptidase [Bacteroidota bacterium]